MSSVKGATKKVIGDYLYNDLGKRALHNKLKNIETGFDGANPHNIAMAASGFLHSHPMSSEKEAEIRTVVIQTFPQRHMKSVFSHDTVEKVHNKPINW